MAVCWPFALLIQKLVRFWGWRRFLADSRYLHMFVTAPYYKHSPDGSTLCLCEFLNPLSAFRFLSLMLYLSRCWHCLYLQLRVRYPDYWCQYVVLCQFNRTSVVRVAVVFVVLMWRWFFPCKLFRWRDYDVLLFSRWCWSCNIYQKPTEMCGPAAVSMEIFWQLEFCTPLTTTT